jgi:hypothetical protein
MKMNIKYTLPLMAAALCMTVAPAIADDSDDDATTATIRLMSNAEAELPEAVTKEIELPEGLRDDSQAVANSEKGLSTANQNRIDGNQGLDMAEQARQKGAEMAESAKDNRENLGRADENRPPPPETPAQNTP